MHGSAVPAKLKVSTFMKVARWTYDPENRSVLILHELSGQAFFVNEPVVAFLEDMKTRGTVLSRELQETVSEEIVIEETVDEPQEVGKDLSVEFKESVGLKGN